MCSRPLTPHPPEGTTEGRERGRPDGGAAPERRWRETGGGGIGSEEAGEEEKSLGRPEGDADADRWQEAGEGYGREEARGRATTEVGLTA
jgi:hypothetical protein